MKFMVFKKPGVESVYRDMLAGKTGDDENSPVYEYTFALWPKIGSKCSQSLYEVMKMMPLAILSFTEDAFALFRYHLLLDGFELHEISRVPAHVPETIL